MAQLLFFLSSGLFLGWSLGANDAANVFGTAVGARMIKFRTAAVICSIFVIIGAVTGGAGASHTLGKLGAVNSLSGAFTVALSAALAVFMMTRTGLPVSTSQAIVGGIIGWNFFSGLSTDTTVIQKIVLTWVLCPVLACFFAVLLYFIIRKGVSRLPVHIFRLDVYTRWGLIVAGAFGSYSLGANNIANVMGVFVESVPFEDFTIFGSVVFTKTQQLFFLGASAIALGVFTYSKRVMGTVGKGIYSLSPVTAFIVVLASSLVLFVFASTGLRDLLISLHLTPIPLVPVSSSQAVVGAVIGIGIAKGGRNIRFNALGRIVVGWVATPIISAVLCFVLLYFMQNVFGAAVN
ncbi:MAG: inorganic phosphate transporter [Spirochaetales bacterium]|uniref:Inorganic phosphate transporter n=1 Tax=Candidatus Thalassospirochaeta sargassi TaxID=3119039 RepID=A0AAJ1MIZ4_9SPIO|nr:inorganic phosphate transporter [Spirochaetales bacterium]